jgi:hypothetical protein
VHGDKRVTLLADGTFKWSNPAFGGTWTIIGERTVMLAWNHGFIDIWKMDQNGKGFKSYSFKKEREYDGGWLTGRIRIKTAMCHFIGTTCFVLPADFSAESSRARSASSCPPAVGVSRYGGHRRRAIVEPIRSLPNAEGSHLDAHQEVGAGQVFGFTGNSIRRNEDPETHSAMPDLREKPGYLFAVNGVPPSFAFHEKEIDQSSKPRGIILIFAGDVDFLRRERVHLVARGDLDSRNAA